MEPNNQSVHKLTADDIGQDNVTFDKVRTACSLIYETPAPEALDVVPLIFLT